MTEITTITGTTTDAQDLTALDPTTGADLLGFTYADEAPLTGKRVLRNRLRFQADDEQAPDQPAIATARFRGPSKLLVLRTSARGRLSAYAEVDCDIDAPTLYTFAVAATGDEVPTGGAFMGTFTTARGPRTVYLMKVDLLGADGTPISTTPGQAAITA